MCRRPAVTWNSDLIQPDTLVFSCLVMMLHGAKPCTAVCKRRKTTDIKKSQLLFKQQAFYIPYGILWWRFTDSNRGPVDYDSIALTDWAKEPEPEIVANDWVQLLELLNKVWDLGLVLLPSYLVVRTICCDRFGFCWLTVQSAFRGRQVSFYTTVGGGVLLKDKH